MQWPILAGVILVLVHLEGNKVLSTMDHPIVTDAYKYMAKHLYTLDCLAGGLKLAINTMFSNQAAN